MEKFKLNTIEEAIEDFREGKRGRLYYSSREDYPREGKLYA